MEATEKIVQIFRRGVPTAPDVDKLMALDLKPGDSIGYGQIETVIGTGYREPRFETITASWRKRLFRERGLELKREGGLFKVLTAREALSARVTGMNRLRRAASREVIKGGVIDLTQLTGDEQARYMLFRRHSAALLGHAQDVCKSIAPPRAIGPK